MKLNIIFIVNGIETYTKISKLLVFFNPLCVYIARNPHCATPTPIRNESAIRYLKACLQPQAMEDNSTRKHDPSNTTKHTQSSNKTHDNNAKSAISTNDSIPLAGDREQNTVTQGTLALVHS